jgi:MFS family permease
MDLRIPPAHTRGTAPALAGLSLAMLVSSLATSIANVALPSLQGEFGASLGRVQWVVLAYLLAITTLVVSAGRLGDILGRRRVLLAGIALFTGASVLCAVAPTLSLLVAARALQGVGAAAMMALALASVADLVPGDRSGAAIGLLGTTSAVGTALGPALGGLLIAAAGWRPVFLVNVPLGIVALALAVRLPVGTRAAEAERPRFDLVGTTLLAVALAAYALAVTLDAGRVEAGALALLGIALTAAVVFALVETRASAPLIRAAVLRRPGVLPGLITSGLVSTVVMATLVVGPFHLTRALGLDPARVGLVMSVGPAVVVAAGVPVGRLADRIGTGRLTVAGLVAMALGAALLSVAPIEAGIPGYLAPLVVLTLGYALVQTSNTAAVMAAAGGADRGAVAGVLTLSRNLGLVTGASVMTAVFALGAGTSSPTVASAAAVADGTRLTFLVAAALIGVALVAPAMRRRNRGEWRCPA